MFKPASTLPKKVQPSMDEIRSYITQRIDSAVADNYGRTVAWLGSAVAPAIEQELIDAGYEVTIVKEDPASKRVQLSIRWDD
jgi:hypothetical protein